jgi:zinc/manganese transport system substrate-binding protein
MRIIPKIVIAALPLFAACAGTDETTEDRPEVVVTTSVLATIVSELVGDAAVVTTIISDGVDPHDFAPSAKDVERMNNAALVVANGLDLEEGLEDVLANLEADRLFVAADHVTTRALKSKHSDEHHSDEHSDEEHSDEVTDEHSDEEHSDEVTDEHSDEHHSDEEHAHDHGGADPHLWLSPFTVSEFVPALATALSGVVGADINGESMVASLLQLDADIAAQIDALDACELITGHDELGYFADRYGCEVIGTVIPSATTTAEASAAQIAELENVVTEHNAKAIFVSLGTPTKIAEQIARDTGVPTVELNTHVVGDSENYDQFMRSVTDTIVDALS